MDDYKKCFSLEGKKALVVGGTGALGKAISTAFLQQGADVAVCGTLPEKAWDLAEYAGQLKKKLLPVRCDITKAQSVVEMMNLLSDEFQTLDILVNCAGMNILLPAENYEEEAFDQVMELNIKGLHLVTREVGRRFMIPRGYGRILSVSSVKGQLGTDRDDLAYCASKGAVNMYVKQIACEWGKYGITSNAIAPSLVKTPVNSFQLDDPVFYKSLTDRIPLGRVASEKDIASAAVFLCSDGAGFISGQILAVDGGLTAGQ